MKKQIPVLLLFAVLCFGMAYADNADGYSVAFTEDQSAGYVWSFTVSDDAVLAVADYGTTDTAGTHAWLISGIGEGQASVSFYYMWAWAEEQQDPQVIYLFSSDAAGKLTLESIEGFPEQYMSGITVVKLAQDSATGLQWEVSIEPQGVLSLVRDTYDMDNTEGSTEGSGGVHSFLFQGEAAGTAVIYFRYVHTPGSGETPEAMVKLTYLVEGDRTALFMGLDGDYQQYFIGAQ